MASFEQEIKQANFANENLKANLNVLFTANFLYNKITTALKPFNLTHEQFNVLRILRGSHPNSMCQKDVLSRMIAPNSNVTLIIKKLLDKKWVTVEQSERDKREYVINITETGLELLARINDELKSKEMVSNKLTTSEAFHLNALLDKLRED
jgi:DNA-binding MarR family transcriptional regulator